jgi:hypothetical protein
MSKDLLVAILIAAFGWGWAVIQFFINRRNQQRDRLQDRKFEAYSSYMKKYDELMNSVRTGPGMIYGISPNFVEKAQGGTEEELNQALVDYTQQLIDSVRVGTEPVLIIKQELNALLLVCSDELQLSIEKLMLLATKFNSDMETALSVSTKGDINDFIREMESISQNND